MIKLPKKVDFLLVSGTLFLTCALFFAIGNATALKPGDRILQFVTSMVHQAFASSTNIVVEPTGEIDSTISATPTNTEADPATIAVENEKTIIPFVTGIFSEEAIALLKKARLNYAIEVKATFGDGGRVIAQDLNAGDSVNVGTVVRITVNGDPSFGDFIVIAEGTAESNNRYWHCLVTVVNIEGRLKRAGIPYKIVEEFSTYVPAGQCIIVYCEDIADGGAYNNFIYAKKGTKKEFDIVVSKGQLPSDFVRVARPNGNYGYLESLAQVESVLKAAEVTYIIRMEYTRNSPAGTVISIDGMKDDLVQLNGVANVRKGAVGIWIYVSRGSISDDCLRIGSVGNYGALTTSLENLKANITAAGYSYRLFDAFYSDQPKLAVVSVVMPGIQLVDGGVWVKKGETGVIQIGVNQGFIEDTYFKLDFWNTVMTEADTVALLSTYQVPYHVTYQRREGMEADGRVFEGTYPESVFTHYNGILYIRKDCRETIELKVNLDPPITLTPSPAVTESLPTP